MRLNNGLEVSDSVIEEVIDSIVAAYASSGFEDFSEAVGLTIQSLQEDDWGGLERTLTYDEACEVTNLVGEIARAFAYDLADAYGPLYEKYITARPWRGVSVTVVTREMTLKGAVGGLDGRRKDLVTIRVDYPTVRIISDRTGEVTEFDSY